MNWSLNRAALDSSASTEHPRAVIEGALAHVVRNQPEAASARSDLFERRRRLGDWVRALSERAGRYRLGSADG